MGDRAGELDKAYKSYIGLTTMGKLAFGEAGLLRAMEQQAYAITGGVFSHPRPDIVNESLTRAWKSLGKFRGESRFSTWFHRIVLNVCKAHGAKETLQRKREVPLDDVDAFRAATSDIAGSGISIREHLSRNEWLFLLDRLSLLPDAEVATKWGLSLSGVRGRWRRIKKKIQAALG